MQPELFEAYYNGCCNATHWPLFHSMPSKSNFSADHWRSYVAANKLFADKTIAAIERCANSSNHSGVPIVWVHDYHLMLCANYIREKGEEKNLQFQLAFFLHIPFPPWDIFRLFPWSDEILQGKI
jgi:trehalose 6-phosphate synthase/phosphatase